MRAARTYMKPKTTIAKKSSVIIVSVILAFRPYI